MPKETQVLTGDVLDKESTSLVEEVQPETTSSPKEIYAIVEKELPVLNTGDKVWRMYGSEVQEGKINSTIPDGTFGNVIVQSGPEVGWGENITIEDGSLSGGWQFGTPPTEQLTGQGSEGVDQELLARHLAMKMSDEGARFQGPEGDFVSPTGEVDDAGNFVLQVKTDDGMKEKSVPPEEFIRDYIMVDEDAVQQPEAQQNPEVRKEPWNKTSRSALRQTIDDYNEKVSTDQQIKLEDLEKEALASLQEASLVNSKLETMSQLLEDEASQLQRYLEKLRVAATRKGLGGEDNLEVKEYFENDLKDKRLKLAELTYKRINSPAAAEWMRTSKNKKELQSAQDTYDEALRALGRWELLGIEGDQVQQQAAVLALAEMQQLRTDINSIETSNDKKWYDKVVDFEWTPERKFGKKKGQKQRLALGRVGLAMAAGFGVGVAARAVLPGISTLTGAVAGATTGALVSGYRAHRDMKSGLNDVATDVEAGVLAENIVDQNASFDEVLRAHLTKEANRSRNERRRAIRKRMGKAAVRGALAGALTGGLIDIAGGMASGDFSREANAAADTPEYATKGEVAIDRPEVQEITPPSTDELLQHYAGDNADAALNIETGEGPYQTLQELGIPEEKWDDLFNNDELMQKLVENGDAYSLQDAGVQEHGWGWTGNELSTDSASDLYDAAGMNTPEAMGMADSGLPPTYAELTPGAQEFAMNHSVVADIPNGMSGEELMRELGVDQDAWYQIEADLRSNAPSDFYTMSDGHIGLSHSGALSAGGVEELLKSLNQHGYTV